MRLHYHLQSFDTKDYNAWKEQSQRYLTQSNIIIIADEVGANHASAAK